MHGVDAIAIGRAGSTAVSVTTGGRTHLVVSERSACTRTSVGAAFAISIWQQNARLAIGASDGGCFDFAAFDVRGQQHASRALPSILQRNTVLANPVPIDSSSSATAVAMMRWVRERTSMDS